MANKIRITVTQEDIDKGVPCNSVRCPIAKAVDRKFGLNLLGASVGSRIITCFHNGKHRKFQMSKSGMKFVQRFDDRKIVEPFTFYATEW